jgi:hypothetical protein
VKIFTAVLPAFEIGLACSALGNLHGLADRLHSRDTIKHRDRSNQPVNPIGAGNAGPLQVRQITYQYVDTEPVRAGVNMIDCGGSGRCLPPQRTSGMKRLLEAPARVT